MDRNTVIAGVASAGILASKDLMVKVAGPTCDYIGGRAKDLVEKADQNLGRIFRKALEKLGEDCEKNGAVNPRVLKHVWDEGRFVEDELAAEYFGGLLASSRNEDGTDDSALPFVRVVSDMSVGQMRLHYAVYLNTLAATPVEVARPQEFTFGPTQVMMRSSELATSLSLGGDFARLASLLAGLNRLGLVGASSGLIVDNEVVDIEPTYFGAELFLRVHGFTESPLELLAGTVPMPDPPLLMPCSDPEVMIRDLPATTHEVRREIEKAAKEAEAKERARPIIRPRPSEALDRNYHHR